MCGRGGWYHMPFCTLVMHYKSLQKLVINTDKIMVQEGGLEGVCMDFVIIKIRSEWLFTLIILTNINFLMVENIYGSKTRC